MSRRDAFTLFFMCVLSGELMATGASLLFDSVLLWWVTQPIVILASLFVVGLLGKPKQREDYDDDTSPW
jgi:hypothetical protein